MSKKHWFTMSVVFVGLLVLVGYYLRQTSSELPAWAPEEPSPEFLSAARVLGSFPAEDSSQEDQSFNQILVPTWEFFGTLDDDQVNSLLANKSISLPFGSLTRKQRSQFDNILSVYRQTMRNAPADSSKDLLVLLYEKGARKDLSNVNLVIDIRPSGTVRFSYMIQQPDGTTSHALSIGLGTIQTDSQSCPE